MVEEGGQRDHLHVGQVAADRRSGADSVHDRHDQVHEHHIRAQLVSELDGLSPVHRLTDHLDGIVDSQEHLQTLANQGVVLGNK